MGLLKRIVVFATAFLPIWVVAGSLAGGGTRGTVSISGGNFMVASSPPAAWGLVVNDTDATLSGGTFSSICFQYETNGTVAATIAPNARVETGDGVWLGFYGSDSSLTVESNATLRGDALVVGYDPVVSNNTVLVSGKGALLDTSKIYLGGSADGAGGTGNRIEVASGGTVATTDLNIYEGNQLDLNSGGTLAIRTNFNASTPGFNFNSGGTLEVGADEKRG